MQDFADDDIVDEVLPIWRAEAGGDLHRLRQNYHYYKNESEAAEHYGVERMGYLRVRLQFKSGVGKIHTKFNSNVDAKDVMEAWQCCVASGLRSATGDFVGHREDENGQPIDESENRASDEIGAEEEEDSDSDSDDDDDEEEEEEGGGLKHKASSRSAKAGGRGHRRNASGQSQKSRTDGNDNGLGEERAGLDADNDEDEEATMLDKLKKWTDERRELHRQHKGLKQYKVVRTASWLGKGVKDRSHRAYDSFKMQDRRAGQVETEL